jgi:hypothetical protein
MWFLVMAITMALVLVSSSAVAGPYLNTSAMLLHESASAGQWVRLNLGDKELARNAFKMAQARTDVASRMDVPSEVRHAHPHLLLSLSAMESAMQAAVHGKFSDFIRQTQAASGEAKTFQAVLRNLGFALPEYVRVAVYNPTPTIPPHQVVFCEAHPVALRSCRRFANPAPIIGSHVA